MSITQPPQNQSVLRDVITNAIVLAYREDVTNLVSSLEREGFRVEVLRPDYSPEELTYSKNSRTFLTHQKAWRKAIATDGYTLICEADFVPCRGIGDFEIFWPTENPYAWGYLYQGSPRLLAIIGPRHFLRVHTAPLVCYITNRLVASLMLTFFEHEKKEYDFRDYFTFDAHLQWHVMGLGGEAFMPKYHYGEHGGLPNPEHAKFGSLSRDGRHRADNLMSALHFLPLYAKGSYPYFLLVRLGAHFMGFARLAANRWIARTNVYYIGTLDGIKMYVIGLRRLISLPL